MSSNAVGGPGSNPVNADLSLLQQPKGNIKLLRLDGEIIQLAAKKIGLDQAEKMHREGPSKRVHVKLADIGDKTNIVEVSVKIKDLSALGLSEESIREAESKEALQELIQSKLQTVPQSLKYDSTPLEAEKPPVRKKSVRRTKAPAPALTPERLDETIKSADKKITNHIKGESELSQTIQILEETHRQVKSVAQDYKTRPFPTTTLNISNLSKLILTLHQSKESVTKEKVEENKKIEGASLGALMGVMAIFIPQANEEQLKIATLAFDEMLRAILTDVHEEVVGQERIPGVIPRIVKNNLISKYNLNVNLEEISQITAHFYPIALLAAVNDSRVKLPQREGQLIHLKRDMEQFVKEYRSQFGKNCSPAWVNGEEFAKSLLQVWTNLREERATFS